jgi:hypothetical protein
VAPVPPIETKEEAVAAVAAVDARFLGYPLQDPNLVGQANYVTVDRSAGGFTLVFMSGSGDCPAGCIDKRFAKVTVTTGGTVVKKCEWAEGDIAQGSPC